MPAHFADHPNVHDVIDTDPAVGWDSLTRMRSKAALYRCETYFREAMADVEAVLGAYTGPLLYRSALVIVKADGLLAGKQRVIHDFLLRHDLWPVAVRQIRFTRMLAREFWRYQLTLASLDRLAVNDWVLTAGPALLLLLRSGGEHDLPASVRLSALKGSANQSEQKPDSLRYLLGQPNRLVNFFHCADEPADIVRELGMLFDRQTRYALFGALAAGQLPPADAEVLETVLTDDAAPRGLDAAEAVRRIVAAVAACDPDQLDPAVRADLHTGLEGMRANRIIAWRPFEAALLASGAELDPWDIAMAGSSFTANDVDGGSKVLVNPDPESWREASGTGQPVPAGELAESNVKG